MLPSLHKPSIFINTISVKVMIKSLSIIIIIIKTILFLPNPLNAYLIEISYINLLLNSSETSTRQMHKRNWDEGWESVQEEEEGMRLGNMKTWRVWNFSFPMHNSSSMKHKLLRIKAQWKNIGEIRRNRHILKNIMIYTICCSILKWWETTLGDPSVNVIFIWLSRFLWCRVMER